MKALSIRQPWAWLIVRPDIVDPDLRKLAYAKGLIKDIENRDWNTHYRGPILIHAGKSKDEGDWTDAFWALREAAGEEAAALLPPFSALECGGIVGRMDILDCVAESASKWFFGDFGFVLANAQPIPFIPLRGQLGLFEVPEGVVPA
jgi:hypothetical protein